MSSSMKAAIHLGPIFLANLEVYKNKNFENIASLFNITHKLIMELSEEILNVKWLESSSPSWTRSVLSHDQALKWAKAKVFVYSDSVLCLGMMHESKDGPLPTKKQWESMEKQLNSSGIFSQDFSSFLVLQEIQTGLARKNIKPEEFRDRIIFMSTFNDMIGQRQVTMEFVFRI